MRLRYLQESLADLYQHNIYLIIKTMAQYFFGITPSERKNILDQHKTVYDGYVTEYGQNNSQPLYVQDFANDKDGITVSNKGVVKTYTNMNINESHSGLDMIGDGEYDLVNGTVDIDDMTDWGDENIEFISLGFDDECDDCGEMEEGFDDFSMKKRYDDYSPKSFRKLPKMFDTGMEDAEGTMLMGKDDDEKYSDYYNDDFNYDVDFDENDDFEPIEEEEFSSEVDEEILPEFTEKLNESLDMFRRFKNYN
jgi:hypothetical protein